MRVVSALAAFLLTLSGDLPAWAQLGVTADATTVQIRSAGKPVLTYKFAQVPYKPYAVQLWSPAGTPILRDAPFDHLHHHALMFALAVDKVDFWSEKPHCGKQLHAGLRAMRSDEKSQASFVEDLDWKTPDGQAVLRETRTITAHAGVELGATLVTWKTRLSAPDGKPRVTLGGSHYFGLGMRFVTSMDAEGAFTCPTGAAGDVVRGSERLTPAKWCAYAAVADGKPVTAALFDAPQNLRHPARMFTMGTPEGKPFAYLSATLNLWKEPFELASDKPLELRYAVAVWDGRASADQIEQLYQRWLTLDAGR